MFNDTQVALCIHLITTTVTAVTVIILKVIFSKKSESLRLYLSHSVVVVYLYGYH